MSYNAMNDNSGLTPDHLYKLTYKLCQLYYHDRAQYAHKRAFLVRKSLHREPNEQRTPSSTFENSNDLRKPILAFSIVV